MNFKKILAFTMAATMVLGSTVTAFASEPTPATADVTTAVELTGAGSSAYVDKNVMSVVVPTANFKYKIDPEGVMSEVKSYDGTAVESVTDETGLIFLNTGSDGKKTVSNYSDAFTITNKSAIPVNIGVTYFLADAATNPIPVASTLADSADFTTTDNASKALYLGLIAYGVDTEKAFTATNTTSTNYMLLDAEAAYKVTDTSGTYTYAIDSTYTGTFPSISFYLTGAINKDVAMSTWYVENSGTRTAKGAPTVNFKYTLTGVKDALEASAGFFGGDDLYIAKTSDNWATGGGFAPFATTAVSAITVNGRSITPASSHVEKLAGDQYTTSYIKIPFAEIAALFGYSSTEITAMDAAAKTAVKGMVKAVSVTQTNTYYGEVQ